MSTNPGIRRRVSCVVSPLILTSYLSMGNLFVGGMAFHFDNCDAVRSSGNKLSSRIFPNDSHQIAVAKFGSDVSCQC